jgi:hypothetical protein
MEPVLNVDPPSFMTCKRCGARCRVSRTDTYEMPAGVAGVAWARCRRCRYEFVHFFGAKEPVAKLIEKWLDVH